MGTICLRTDWNIDIENSAGPPDRKSTRLNSSHLVISYAVFCLKKKKKKKMMNLQMDIVTIFRYIYLQIQVNTFVLPSTVHHYDLLHLQTSHITHTADRWYSVVI